MSAGGQTTGAGRSSRQADRYPDAAHMPRILHHPRGNSVQHHAGVPDVSSGPYATQTARHPRSHQAAQTQRLALTNQPEQTAANNNTTTATHREHSSLRRVSNGRPCKVPVDLRPLHAPDELSS
ncbi:hypothetical protein INR49_023262, partial [Caranx melampygus]